jgi:hypothetical protein
VHRRDGIDAVELGDGLGVGDVERRRAAAAAAHPARRGVAGEDDEDVAAHRADGLRHGVLRALADGHHQHHGADADHHAEHGEEGAQAVGAHGPPGFAQHGA